MKIIPQIATICLLTGENTFPGGLVGVWLGGWVGGGKQKKCSAHSGRAGAGAEIELGKNFESKKLNFFGDSNLFRLNFFPRPCFSSL